MAQNKKSQGHEEASEVVRFVRKQVDPLSKLFSVSPLAQLSVKTKQGSITLEKAGAIAAPPEIAHPEAIKAAGEPARLAAQRYTPLVPAQNGEAGRTYITINAEVVGIFRDSPNPPVTGERLGSGQVLGYIEALKLRNEVHCPADAALVAQVVVDGQPVDFGEALFVVDTTESQSLLAEPLAAEAPAAVAIVEAAVEPPRM